MERQTEFSQLIETIDDVPRDLAFYPSTVADPQVLTVDQLASYNAVGYVKGFRVGKGYIRGWKQLFIEFGAFKICGCV
jgi:hypothetical protein